MHLYKNSHIQTTQPYLYTYTYIHTYLLANIGANKSNTHIHTQTRQCPIRPLPAFFQGFFLTPSTNTLTDFLHTRTHSCTNMLKVIERARERDTETVTERERECGREREQTIFFSMVGLIYRSLQLTQELWTFPTRVG